MRALYSLIFILSIASSGCVAQGGGSAGGSSGSGTESSTLSSTPLVNPVVYTFEVSGNGLSYTVDFSEYSEVNYAGTRTDTSDAQALGAATVTYTKTAKSLSMLLTRTAGVGGILTVVMKEDGVPVRTDNLTINGAQMIVNDANN